MRGTGIHPARRAAAHLVLGACLAAGLGGDALPLSRNSRTVFKTQPLEWEAELGRDGKPATLTFAARWTFSGFRAPLAGDPVPCGGLLVAAARDGEVAALDPEAGTVSWRVRLEGAIGIGPAASEGAVYVAAGPGRLSALGGGDGRVLWAADLGAEPTSPPRLLAGRLLVATAAPELLALDPTTGAVVARRGLPGRPTTPPEPAPGLILIGTEEGSVVALEGPGLEVRWRREAERAVSAPLLVERGKVYAAVSDRSVRCLRLRSGRRLWTARTGAVTTAGMFVRGPYLYVLNYDNDIYVLERRNGHLIARIRMGHRLDASPATTDEHVFIVPFTEAALVGLALPGLGMAGRYALEVPGEWFTTSPVLMDGMVALGYGRTEGKIVALSVARAAPDAKRGETGKP